jgi:hypothetical protein
LFTSAADDEEADGSWVVVVVVLVVELDGAAALELDGFALDEAAAFWSGVVDGAVFCAVWSGVAVLCVLLWFIVLELEAVALVSGLLAGAELALVLGAELLAEVELLGAVLLTSGCVLPVGAVAVLLLLGFAAPSLEVLVVLDGAAAEGFEPAADSAVPVLLVDEDALVWLAHLSEIIFTLSTLMLLSLEDDPFTWISWPTCAFRSAVLPDRVIALPDWSVNV